MYYYVYKITNQINGKYYIGAHSTKKLDDGYMGSGKRIRYAINKYGVENFSKEILGFYNTKVEMYLAEKELVKLSDECYNLVEGGGGIDPLNSIMFDNPAHSLDHIRKMNQARKHKLKTDDDFAKHMKSKYAKGGKAATAKHKETEGFYDDFSKFGVNARKISLTYKDTLRKALKEINHQQGKANSQFGKKWITNHSIRKSKPVQISELETYLAEGWVLGRDRSYDKPWKSAS